MKERRILHGEDLRRLCIKKNWYTHGNGNEYGAILNFANECEDITTEAIVKIANDIFDHSNKEYWKEYEGDPIENICFEIARTCYSFFEKETMRDFHGVMEIRNFDGLLVNASMAHAKRAKGRPKSQKRSIGNTIGTTTYFSTDIEASTYYNALKIELDSQKEKTA